MIYLHKILPLIISPLFFIILIISLGIILKSKKISIAGILIFLICSLPIVSSNLIYYLEKDYRPINISKIEDADAIIVLSGMTKPIKKDDDLIYEFNESIDRILAGIKLIEKNKAPYLILTRGKVPWSKGKPEGEILLDFVLNYGIEKQKIILTENVQNTDQEAKAVKKLFPNKDQKIILVTSAFHMPRAIKVFQAAGVDVVPFPVDFRSSNQKFSLMNLIPQASAFSSTSHFIREMQGRIYYELKY
jgi:uncharacterized SAM-binding protein YcdF (DUF218 family)